MVLLQNASSSRHRGWRSGAGLIAIAFLPLGQSSQLVNFFLLFRHIFYVGGPYIEVPQVRTIGVKICKDSKHLVPNRALHLVYIPLLL